MGRRLTEFPRTDGKGAHHTVCPCPIAMNISAQFKLRDELSVCQVDDHLIFLDIDKDLYFRLPATLERAFLDYMAGSDGSNAGIAGLIEHQILVATNTPALQALLPIPHPNRSAIEQSIACVSVRATTAIEVAALVWPTRRRLQTRPLRHVLESMAAERQRRATSRPQSPGPIDHVVAAAQQFRKARRYVPVEPVCLLDSVSLVLFLARRALHAEIIFGVTYDPFSAHCWVQAGDMALNDTVGNTGVYAPIRRV